MTDICKYCGYSFSEFKECGQLGCSNCYKNFDLENKLFKNKTHKGIYPNKWNKYFELLEKYENAIDCQNLSLADSIKSQMNLFEKEVQYE